MGVNKIEGYREIKWFNRYNDNVLVCWCYRVWVIWESSLYGMQNQPLKTSLEETGMEWWWLIIEVSAWKYNGVSYFMLLYNKVWWKEIEDDGEVCDDERLSAVN